MPLRVDRSLVEVELSHDACRRTPPANDRRRRFACPSSLHSEALRASTLDPEAMPKVSKVEPVLLDCAVRLFGDSGYEGVGSRALAAAAKSTETSMYRLFGSKDNLYQKAVEIAVERAHRVAGLVVARVMGEPPPHTLNSLCAIALGWHAELGRPDARLIHQVLKQVTKLDVKLKEKAAVPLSQITNILARQLQTSGESLAREPEAAVRIMEPLVLALFHYKVVQAADHPSTTEIDHVSLMVNTWGKALLGS